MTLHGYRPGVAEMEVERALGNRHDLGRLHLLAQVDRFDWAKECYGHLGFVHASGVAGDPTAARSNHVTGDDEPTLSTH